MKGIENDKNQEMTEYVYGLIPGMWNRIRRACAEKGTSVGAATTAVGLNPSAVYNTIREVDAGRPYKDFELYLIKSLSEYLDLDINYVVYGTEQITAFPEGDLSSDKILESIRVLSGGSMKSMMLSMLAFLTEKEQDALYADVMSRFPEKKTDQ